MALQSSGNITIRDIAIEAGVSESDLDLRGLATDGHFTVNTASPSYPNTSEPHSLSEWYSYDHSASAGWTLVNSLLHDGVNDWSRMTGSNYANICEIFNSGGTTAFAFQCTGTTSSANQYLWQGAWGGGQNWLTQSRDYSGGSFQLRFRHDFSGSNYICEPHASSGQRPFATNRWYFVCMTYDNSSTSNNMTWYYGDYSQSTLTTITSPLVNISVQHPTNVIFPLNGLVTAPLPPANAG